MNISGAVTILLIWGVFCVFVAQFSNNLGNSLIEAVNIFRFLVLWSDPRYFPGGILAETCEGNRRVHCSAADGSDRDHCLQSGNFLLGSGSMWLAQDRW